MKFADMKPVLSETEKINAMIKSLLSNITGFVELKVQSVDEPGRWKGFFEVRGKPVPTLDLSVLRKNLDKIVKKQEDACTRNGMPCPLPPP